MAGGNSRCVFCTISRQHQQNSKNSDDNIYVIPDIKPDADLHYLVIPHEHYKTPKSLTKQHLPLVNLMVTVDKRMLVEKIHGGDEEKLKTVGDYKMGFHWPPFHSVEHLHMHILYPVSKMSFRSRIQFQSGIGYVSVDWLLKRIKDLPDTE